MCLCTGLSTCVLSAITASRNGRRVVAFHDTQRKTSSNIRFVAEIVRLPMIFPWKCTATKKNISNKLIANAKWVHQSYNKFGVYVMVRVWLCVYSRACSFVQSARLSVFNTKQISVSYYFLLVLVKGIRYVINSSIHFGAVQWLIDRVPTALITCITLCCIAWFSHSVFGSVGFFVSHILEIKLKQGSFI